MLQVPNSSIHRLWRLIATSAMNALWTASSASVDRQAEDPDSGEVIRSGVPLACEPVGVGSVPSRRWLAGAPASAPGGRCIAAEVGASARRWRGSGAWSVLERELRRSHHDAERPGQSQAAVSVVEPLRGAVRLAAT